MYPQNNHKRDTSSHYKPLISQISGLFVCMTWLQWPHPLSKKQNASNLNGSGTGIVTNIQMSRHTGAKAGVAYFYNVLQVGLD